MKELSRRNFIKGALAGGAAVAAGAGLAACSPASPQSAAADGQKAAEAGAEGAASTGGGRWSWSVKPEPITEFADTYDADVCIVGLGAAGAPSALYAATHGLKTVVLQKGNAAISNGWCANAINNKAWLESGGEPFDTGKLYADFAEISNGRDNGKLVMNFLNRGGEVMNWIMDNTPEKTPVVVEKGQTIGWYVDNDFSTRYAQYAELLKLMGDKAEAAGATMLWDTPAVQLITNESGDVTGVIGQNKKGEYVRVNTSKGVLMACGDISDDEEMLECYAPLLLGVHNMHGAPNNTGDAVRMGSWIGAQVTPAPHALMMHFDPTWLPEGNAPFSGIPWLRVNKKGVRFGNEDAPYQGVVQAVAAQPEKLAFQITDSHWMDHIDDMPNPNSHSRETADPAKDWEKAVKGGAIIESDTLEGLAEAYDIDKQTFLATVERYNELCDKGVDEDFGVKGEFMGYTAIKEPPFYAIKRAPGVLATVGGLQVEEHSRVLDENGDVIKGLWAAGDCGGSFYGHEYPMVLPGGSIGRGFVLGVLSVKDMMDDFDSMTA
ncbi:FAD-dependent oxidoreductase [Eggerthella sinensis]|uniref:FAD-dependent oxidoreductase n=2 Tax=Eggerthella sinensis TaxID=242230 RepID=UPI00266BACAC|nr:FAD-binding protein [Eggerthella sinensis]